MIVGAAMIFMGFPAHSDLGEALCVRPQLLPLGRGMGGQADQEAAIYKGQPNPRLLSQVGQQQKGVEKIGAGHSPV